LVQHLGEVHRFWAAAVSAGPAPEPPAGTEGADTTPRELEAVLAWSAASTQQLLDSLSAAGPDRGCWTWWGMSESPQTSGAVARHQVQEASVHTYDAQLTAGAPQPLPADAALDGIGEFLTTCCSGPDPWPHEAAVLGYHAAEGPSWRLSLSADGAWTTRPPAPGTVTATARGTASDLVLALYGRLPVGSLQLDGDPRLFELFRDWD
jgi:uncharacterized protein (TIGR03083 family)